MTLLLHVISSHKLAGLRSQLANSSKGHIRNLNADEQRRFDKLTGLLARLKAGQHVQNRALQTWLKAEEYQSMLDAWDEQIDLRDELSDKPAELKDYEELLRVADFEYNKGNFAKADGKYERALEHLQEVLAADPSQRIWLDREADFEPGGDVSLCPAGVPRIITSRSSYRIGGVMHRERLSKHEVKVRAVEAAIEAITKEPKPEDSGKRSTKLEALLRLPDGEDYR